MGRGILPISHKSWYGITTVRNLFQVLREVEDQIRQKEAELTELRTKRDALRTSAPLLMEKEDKEPDFTDGKLSGLQMTFRVLSEANQPMHVKDISAAIKAKFNKSVSPEILASNIQRNMSRAKRQYFRRTGPNVFGLLAWSVQRIAPERAGDTSGAVIPAPNPGERQVFK